MPGNIHVGPTARLIPGDTGYDPEVDDGGDGFEEAAKQVVPTDHFKALQRADQLIDQYLQDADPKHLAKLAGELAVISTKSGTEYDPGNWIALEGGRYRLKKKV